MAYTTFQVVGARDEEVIAALRSVWERLPEHSNATLALHFGENVPMADASVAMNNLDSDPIVERLRRVDTAALHQASLSATLQPSGQTISATLTRALSNQNPPQHADTVRVQVPDQLDQRRTLDFILSVREAFARYDAVGAMQRALGDEAGTTLKAREEGLLRLEELAARIVRDTADWQRQADASVAARKRELEAEAQRERDALEAAYGRREAALADREAAIDTRLRELDDREFTHVRRDLHKKLREQLDAWSTQFALTEETGQKRRPIHVAFIASMLVLLGFAAWAFIDLRAATDTQHFVYDAVRGALSLGGFLGMMIYYIRWNQEWAAVHADEEFKLKRMALDIDRASWIVEMAFEWKDEKGTQIPQELVDRLTDNLFAVPDGERRARHPGQDIASALLRASASARVPLPFGGEVTLDRKGVRDLEKLAGDDA